MCVCVLWAITFSQIEQADHGVIRYKGMRREQSTFDSSLSCLVSGACQDAPRKLCIERLSNIVVWLWRCAEESCQEILESYSMQTYIGVYMQCNASPNGPAHLRAGYSTNQDTQKDKKSFVKERIDMKKRFGQLLIPAIGNVVVSVKG